MQHERGCPGGKHSDAAKRVYDTYNLHRLFGDEAIGKWFACALADGTSDGTLYGSKQAAIRGQHHNENFYAFIQVVPTSMNLCDAEAFILVSRRAYDAGMRPGDGKELIKRSTREDQIALSRGVATNLQGIN